MRYIVEFEGTGGRHAACVKKNISPAEAVSEASTQLIEKLNVDLRNYTNQITVKQIERHRV